MRREMWLGALLALGIAGEAAATGPLAPLKVRDGAQPWNVLARIETRKFSLVTVRRLLFQKSDLLGTKLLALIGPDEDGAEVLLQTVPVDAQDLSSLPDGYYHLAIVAEGELRKPDSPRYRNQHLVHFKVEEGVATRLTQAQYSAATDPVVVLESPDGSIHVQRGGGVAGPRPAPGPHSADLLVALNTTGIPGSPNEKNER